METKLDKAVEIITEFLNESGYVRLTSQDLDPVVERAREFLKTLPNERRTSSEAVYD